MIQRRTRLATLAATSVARAAEPITIRFGFANVGEDNRQFSGGNFIAAAHAEHYIENELKDLPGVKVEYAFFKGAGPAVNEAFANSQLDFASQGDLPQIIARANGLKTRQLAAAGAHAPMYLAVAPDSDIHAIKDLKGRKVALFRGTNNHLAAVKVLAANGMTERDFQGINMDEASANAALATRNIDAAFGNYGVLLLSEKGLARIAYSTKGQNPTFERQSTLIASDSFVAA
jgi:sulfonate transport system substrate-binding protein